MSKASPPDYPEATTIAQAFIRAAPERLVWGSDWPHPSEQNGALPDDALLFDLLAVWAPDEATRKRILVDNPGKTSTALRNRRNSPARRCLRPGRDGL